MITSIIIYFIALNTCIQTNSAIVAFVVVTNYASDVNNVNDANANDDADADNLLQILVILYMF